MWFFSPKNPYPALNDICSCFMYTRFLMFADDLKLYLTIKSKDNCKQVQADLDSLWHWFRENRLYLNLKKFNTITFTKKRNLTLYDYLLGGHRLERVNSIRDLGVSFVFRLCFAVHIEVTARRALRTRSFRDFLQFP